MSVRSTILKALTQATRGGGARAAGAAEDIVEGPLAAATRRKPRGRKMPPQGKHYATAFGIQRHPLMPWKFHDSTYTYDQVRIGKNVWMRREDGVWFKPRRDGEWTSVLSPPKGGESAYRVIKVKRAVTGAAIGGAGVVGVNEMIRERK